MSAIKGNKVKIWIIDEPDSKYWDIVKKVKSITFVSPEKENGKVAMEVKVKDKIGRTDIIYLGELNDNYVYDSMTDHKGLYEEDGEFETKDMCLVKVFRPEVVTLEYIKENKTLLAKLVRRVLLERVWNV